MFLVNFKIFLKDIEANKIKNKEVKVLRKNKTVIDYYMIQKIKIVIDKVVDLVYFIVVDDKKLLEQKLLNIYLKIYKEKKEIINLGYNN